MKDKLPRKYRIISRVRRLDAPENIVSLRYVGMHNGFAGDTKTAETLVLSGFSGGGGALSKPRAAFAHTVCSYTWETAKEIRLLSNSVYRAPMSSPGGRTEIYDFEVEVGVNTVHFCTCKPAKDERPPLRHPATRINAVHVNCHLAGSQTKKRHKLRLTCVFAMQKK